MLPCIDVNDERFRFVGMFEAELSVGSNADHLQWFVGANTNVLAYQLRAAELIGQRFAHDGGGFFGFRRLFAEAVASQDANVHGLKETAGDPERLGA